MRCEICQGRNTGFAFRKQNSVYFRCSDCGLFFIHPKPDAADLKKLYGKAYYAPWHIEESSLDTRANKIKTFNVWLDKIEKHVKEGKLLDVGCAVGFFLEASQLRGWEPYGVEISQYASAKAAEKFPVTIKNGTLKDAHFPAGYFDALTMFDLIEHEPDPLAFMQEVSRVLLPGGFAAISTLNSSSLSRKLMQVNWPHFKEEHLFYYSLHSLSLLLKASGFEVIEVTKAYKVLTIRYIKEYFAVYKMQPVTFLLDSLCKALPRRLSLFPLNISFGEMFVIARKK